ncbi:flagellar assembly peptidoglycan hydrolase FlgJ [Burkholderia sp. WAC0059]|uniref:flagellar assembly peptidoglycan hydrolase FlgJ n=1 Tax=Burkholderia sp. WAC0059 TaxID=2066022 RepID=UPI000C7EC81A|nr:flagellar assembly peptidoglycan hydrolase FlgJ [Burkholderia sp. WAC0059]PLZ00665.1 flagellar assembly peptidoglycan hydrolase FlgJ [Burkholderia sp. WAC0059]
MDNSEINAGMDMSNRFALDVQGFDSMRMAAKASPDQGVKMAARQFDTVFLNMMLKSMREATPDDGPLDSHDGDSFTSMLDQQLAQTLSSKGIGVANAMIKQLTLNMGGKTGGAGGSSGSLAMLNALGRAYGNASANGALGGGGEGYGANSELVPPLHGNGASPKVDAFVNKLAQSARQASAATGIPARFIIGQAALESGWGKSEIRQANGATSHNVFGIKATKDWTGKTVSTVTTEYVNGQPRHVVERFRAYDSYEDAMTDYANMLKGNPRYAEVLNSSHSPEGFAQGMQRAGYATDPHYARKLMSIMQQMA